MLTTATRRTSVTNSIIHILATTSLLFASIVSALKVEQQPKPTTWPKQFHSPVMVNYSGKLQLNDLWYDWTNGRNFNIIQYQLGKLYYDLEWNNGTSFGYYLDSDRKCSSIQFDFGILRPTYVGQRKVDGFECYVWEKADFITYYEDVVTRRPVLWVFYTGREAHVMTFEVGAVLEDAKWQVPWYCFEETVLVTTMKGVDGAITHRDLVDFGTRNFRVK